MVYRQMLGLPALPTNSFAQAKEFRIDHELTPRGHSLHEPSLALAAWARSQQPGVEASQRRYDEQE